MGYVIRNTQLPSLWASTGLLGERHIELRDGCR